MATPTRSQATVAPKWDGCFTRQEWRIAGRELTAESPRACTRERKGVLEAASCLRMDGGRQSAMRERFVAGQPSQNCRRALECVLKDYRAKKTDVSGKFVSMRS